jgi:acetyl-CoA C-acetyltransferase
MIDVFIYDTLRTPLGKGSMEGALFEVKPIDLLSKCLKALQNRNQFDVKTIEDFILGCVLPIGGQADNIAKTALLRADWPSTIPGLQINRLQASGLVAVGLAAAKIKAGWAGQIIAGGLESMSRVHREDNRGAISSDPDIINRIGSIPIGIAADLLATLKGYSKEQLDKYAYKSIQKALKAKQGDYFKKSIIPIYDQNQILILKEDETIEETKTLKALSNETSCFPKENRAGFETIALKKYPLVERIIPIHSKGNTAAAADSAALALLANEDFGKRNQLKPRAKIVDMATLSTDFTLAHLGGVEAAKKVLDKANLKAKDIDLWYVNEPFAASALYFQQSFKLTDKKLNPCGGNIAFGDSLGANGLILLGMLMDELERQNLKRGLLSLNAESGLGTSIIIEMI